MDLENSSSDTACGHQIQSKVSAEGVEELHLIIHYLFYLSVNHYKFTTKGQYYLVLVLVRGIFHCSCVDILVFPCLYSPTSRVEST